MNVIELNRALRQLRLGGMAAVLETRLHQAQAEPAQADAAPGFCPATPLRGLRQSRAIGSRACAYGNR